MIRLWLNSSNFAFFGMYFLMSLFAFSTVPFCHEAYESAKYTTTLSFPLMLSFFDISRCAANSHPLSVVMVFNDSLYGNSSLHTTRAVGKALRPCSSFSMSMKFVERSVSVRITCPYESPLWCPFPNLRNASRLPLRDVDVC